MARSANIYRSLLLVISGATQKELARQVQYLNAENQILRRRVPGRVLVTPRERSRPVRLAGKLTGKVVRQLVSIVHPDTLLRWIREDRKAARPKRGRRPTPDREGDEVACSCLPVFDGLNSGNLTTFLC